MNRIYFLVLLFFTGCSTQVIVPDADEQTEYSFVMPEEKNAERVLPHDFTITQIEVMKEQPYFDRVLFACYIENPVMPITLDLIEGTYHSNDNEAQMQLKLEVEGKVVRSLCPGDEFAFTNVDQLLEPGKHKVRLVLESTHGKGDLMQIEVTRFRIITEVHKQFLARSVLAE